MKTTQKQLILEALLRGESFTGLDGVKLFRTLALRNRISELRAEGYAIKDEFIHNPENGKQYKKYWMDIRKEPVYSIREQGQLVIF
jgi:hypothetical protein